MTLTHLQKLPKNVRDLDKLIVSKGFKKLPKLQKIGQSGHTALSPHQYSSKWLHKVAIQQGALSILPYYILQSIKPLCQ